MSGWYFVIFGVVGAVLWIIFEIRKTRKWQRSLAESRDTLTDEQFVDELQKLGVSNGTARFLLDEINFYYYPPLRPDPTDRIYSTLSIDPFDIADIIEKHWRELHDLPAPAENVVCPDDPSLAELGLFMDALVSTNSGLKNGHR